MAKLLNRNSDAYRIALAMGVKLCPCNKIFHLCSEHKDSKPPEKRKLYTSKVTDPKSGFYPGSKGHQLWKESRRDQLRANPEPAEKVLLQFLTVSNGWTFQPIINGFIPDFAHAESKVIVECDGAPHYTTAGKRRDARRDNVLRLNGWAIKRFSNSQCINQTEAIIESINACVHARLIGRG